MNKVYDIIIIGAGPAGMTAAIYATRASKDILLLDKFTPGGRVKSTYQVDNYLGFGKVNAHELVGKMVDHLHGLNIQETYGLAQDIFKNEEGLFVVKTDEDTYLSKTVIVATGTGPKPLEIENEQKFLARGVSYCAVCDAMFFENEDVVMIGGGDAALEEGYYLSTKCKHVTIIHEFDAFSASKQIVQKLLAQDNVTCKYLSSTTRFDGMDELESVTIVNKITQQEEKIHCAGAFIYIGNQADTSFLSGLLHNTKEDFVEVTPDMKTKIDGLFACGDVTKKDYRFIVTAISDGAIAAMTAIKYIDEELK